MKTVRVGILGGSGYAGMELARLVFGHPHLELAFATSDRWAQDSVAARLGLPTSLSPLRFSEPDQAPLGSCEVVLLATPAEISLELAPRILSEGRRVIDLSGAFRLSDTESFRQHYRLEPSSPEWRARAVYGLPELCREGIAGAQLVANPGCYPTAAVLALAPLLRAGLVEPDSLIADAASGVTGAGRKAAEDYSLAELTGDFRAYRVLRHQHTPEIIQALQTTGAAGLDVTFTPHLLPIPRGILCTCYARLRQPATPGDLTALLDQAYQAEPFVEVACHPDEVSLRQVVGTNRCLLAVSCDPATRRLVVVSAIDNLVKGAAGQALQNLNLMLGWPEATGLATLRRFTP